LFVWQWMKAAAASFWFCSHDVGCELVSGLRARCATNATLLHAYV
jgi:hypothetical protein